MKADKDRKLGLTRRERSAIFKDYMRKRSKNAVRRQRPEAAPANTYRVEVKAWSMADVREFLKRRREAKG